MQPGWRMLLKYTWEFRFGIESVLWLVHPLWVGKQG